MLLIAGYALVAGGAVGAAAAWILRLMRGRSILAHVLVLLTATVLAVTAGVAAVAHETFLSGHDLEVVLLTVTTSALASLGVGVVFGRRLAVAAVWAEAARDRERRMEAGRRELVAWVSHDLRTPLAGLRAMAEALEDGVVETPAEVADYHRRIRAASDRMTVLVDDLFELSRITAGALRLDPVTVPLREVVSDALADLAPLAAERDIALVAAETGWPSVRAGERELARVVTNLLANAVRYTPPGGSVRIEAGRQEREVWLAVADTCGGIPDDDLPRVFDIAFRGQRARTPDAGGGLGLAIVRGLVEAHGGCAQVRNTAEGCRFEVSLPAG